MRDAPKTWVDYMGRSWPIVKSPRRLKFMYPAHAALRAHIFHRDGYSCLRCGAKAVDVPSNYDGHQTLFTDRSCGIWPAMLILDHILTLKAGGRSVIENLQALCEVCNRRKQKEDKAAIAVYQGGGL